MLRSRLLLLSLVALGLAGCGGDDGGSTSSPDTGGPTACTEIGCSSGLFVDLAQLKQSVPGAKRVRLCIDDHCKTFAAGDPQAAVTEPLGSQGSVEVSMTVYGEGGKALERQRRREELKRVKPNGDGCPPVCFQVSLAIDPKTGGLEQA